MGRLLHGCPQQLSRTAAAYTRVTFLVNIWLKHRLLGCSRLPANVAYSMSDVSCSRLGTTADAVRAATTLFAVPVAVAPHRNSADGSRFGLTQLPSHYNRCLLHPLLRRTCVT